MRSRPEASPLSGTENSAVWPLSSIVPEMVIILPAFIAAIESASKSSGTTQPTGRQAGGKAGGALCLFVNSDGGPGIEPQAEGQDHGTLDRPGSIGCGQFDGEDPAAVGIVARLAVGKRTPNRGGLAGAGDLPVAMHFVERACASGQVLCRNRHAKKRHERTGGKADPGYGHINRPAEGGGEGFRRLLERLSSHRVGIGTVAVCRGGPGILRAGPIASPALAQVALALGR